MCNRPLLDRESIELGFGPTCWRRLSALARAGVPSSPAAGRTHGPHDPPAAPSAPDDVREPVARGAAGPATAERGTAGHEAPGTGGIPHETAPLALTAVGWLAVLVALVALVEYWRWVALGLAALGACAVIGVLTEWVVTRRHDGPGSRRGRGDPWAPGSRRSRLP